MTESDHPLPPLQSLLQHRTWVRAVARRLLRDEQAAEDLAQDAWVQALRSPPEPGRDPRPWLRRVLKNLASNRRRGDGRRARRESAWRETRAQKTPEALVAEAETHRRLVSHVLDLEEPFKTVLVLRFYEGLTPPEIAARMGTAVGTVHSRLSRAVERLKARLDREEGGDRKAWLAGLLPLAEGGELLPAAATGSAAATAGVLMTLTHSKFAWCAGIVVMALLGVGIPALLLAPSEEAHEDTAHLRTLETEAEGPALEAKGLLKRAEPSSTGAEKAPSVVRELASQRWHGRVLLSDGSPAAEAEVFVLPFGAPGLELEVLEDARFGRVTTDTEGRFVATPGALDRPRLVAWSYQGLATSVSLASRDPSEPITLTLGERRLITIVVDHPSGAWPQNLHASLGTVIEGFDRTDDPTQQSLSLGWGRSPGPRAAVRRVHVHSQASLRVLMEPPEGWAVAPAFQILDGGADRAEFQVMRSAVLRFDLVDVSTGKAPPPGSVSHLFFTEAKTGAIIASEQRRDPRFEVTRRLAPGHYHYEFRVGGYEPLEGDVHVRRAGETIGGALRLRPIREDQKGRVLVTLRDPENAPQDVLAMAHTGAGKDAGQVYLVLERRQGETRWRDVWSTRLPDGRFEIKPYGVATRNNPADWGIRDYFVARRDTGTVGVLLGVRTYPGQDNTFDLTLKPGTFVRLLDVVGKDEALADLQIRAGAAGVMAPIRFEAHGWSSYVSEGEMRNFLSVPHRSWTLGPFPAPEVEVVVTPKGGKSRTLRVSGASVVAGSPKR